MLTLLIPLLTTTASASASCPTAAAPIHLADVQDASLNEISGIAPSPSTRGVFWAHEDSGDGPTLYALDRTGALLATFTVTGATAVDWEDMASTRDANGDSLLYLADIGDNGWNRPDVTVWRVTEPTVDPAAPTDGATVTAERIDLTWPNGPHNAETLLYDAANDELVIVAKTSSGYSDVAVAPATPGSHVMQHVGALQFGAAPLLAGNVETTGGAVAPDGTGAVIRTYDTAYYWPVPAGSSVADALMNETPCEIPLPGQQQGEAITFSRRSSAIGVMSEGTNEPIWKIPLQ